MKTQNNSFEVRCCICNKIIPNGTIIDVDCFEIVNGQYACNIKHARKAEKLYLGGVEEWT